MAYTKANYTAQESLVFLLTGRGRNQRLADARRGMGAQARMPKLLGQRLHQTVQFGVGVVEMR